MPVPPRFDHDECRRLYATGQWTKAALSRRYGISANRILQILDPEAKARANARSLAWNNAYYWQPCRGCGRRVKRQGNAKTTGLCLSCLGVSRRTAEHGTETRYNRGCTCDECRAAASAARRRRRKAHPEAERIYQREYQRRRRART